jgi:uncharacterized membrane protein YuzA (DUF378 family)
MESHFSTKNQKNCYHEDILKENHMKGLICCLTKLLIIIGALNWGAVGFFKYNVVAHIFGGMEMSMGARVVYDVVGIAGVLALLCWIKRCTCSGCKCNGSCSCCKK